MIGNNFNSIGFENSLFKQNKRVSFEAEYLAILNEATTLGYTKPTFNQQIKQNLLLKSMKNNGSWALNDLILVFANNGSKEFACINWKNPTGAKATLINSPTFTANQGFTGNGTTSYILTGYNPNGSLNYKQNNASRFMYVRTAAANKVLDGIAASTANSITSFVSMLQRINQGGGNTIVNIDFSDVGMKSIHRQDSLNIVGINNTTQTPTTRLSLSLSASEQAILRSASAYGTQQISFYSMGAYLVAQNNQIVTDFNTYLASL